MSWIYPHLVRPLLFAQEAEEAHLRAMRRLSWISTHPLICDAVASFFGAQELPTEVFGLCFPNPVGLAAGMDKAAEAVPAWAALGFGFSELGGVTWQAQPGNPTPRLFRAVQDHAIINRMGFNNPGAQALALKLAQWRAAGRWPNHPVGINLGKSKATPLDQAAEDYAKSFRALRDHADFFVVNVSSPNTPGLRQLQDKAALDEILHAIQGVQEHEGTCHSPLATRQSSIVNRQLKPVLIKVSPDLSFEALDDILELVGPRQIAGLIATNTTTSRPETPDPQLQRTYAEAGGLSGAPLRARSTEIVRHIYRQTGGQLPVIGVGGIFNAADAWEKIAAGARLVQVYTGLVYEGPGLARAIVSGLLARLERHGLKRIEQAVGIGNQNE